VQRLRFLKKIAATCTITPDSKKVHKRMGTTLRSSYLSTLAILAILATLAASVLLAACGTTSEVTASANPDVYQVTGKATGTRMSWVTARSNAMDAAKDYCKQRAQRVSIKSEATSGVRSMEEQSATIHFTCVPQTTSAEASAIN
jgi:uncharacterized lipoprotein YajG